MIEAEGGKVGVKRGMGEVDADIGWKWDVLGAFAGFPMPAKMVIASGLLVYLNYQGIMTGLDLVRDDDVEVAYASGSCVGGRTNLEVANMREASERARVVEWLPGCVVIDVKSGGGGEVVAMTVKTESGKYGLVVSKDGESRSLYEGGWIPRNSWTVSLDGERAAILLSLAKTGEYFVREFDTRTGEWEDVVIGGVFKERNLFGGNGVKALEYLAEGDSVSVVMVGLGGGELDEVLMWNDGETEVLTRIEEGMKVSSVCFSPDKSKMAYLKGPIEGELSVIGVVDLESFGGEVDELELGKFVEPNLSWWEMYGEEVLVAGGDNFRGATLREVLYWHVGGDFVERKWIGESSRMFGGRVLE